MKCTNLTTVVSAAVLMILSGCGKSGVERLSVTGSITWKGENIPAGMILFDPDVTKKNRGPQGYAVIRNGKYDTLASESKGCVAGPQRVVIRGFDGKNPRQFHRFGDPIFEPFETTIDIPPNGGNLDFVVPASVKPAEKSANMPL